MPKMTGFITYPKIFPQITQPPQVTPKSINPVFFLPTQNGGINLLTISIASRKAWSF